MAATVGVFPHYCFPQPTVVKVHEEIHAVGGIVQFTATDEAGKVILQTGAPVDGNKAMDLHVSDANGNPLFRLKRGTLDMGFEGEHPDGKGKFFKVHKKAFSESPDLAAHFEDQNGSNDQLRFHFDTQDVSHKDKHVTKITERHGKRVNYTATDDYTFQVAPNVDVALVTTLYVCADQHICDRRNEGYTTP